MTTSTRILRWPARLVRDLRSDAESRGPVAWWPLLVIGGGSAAAILYEVLA